MQLQQFDIERQIDLVEAEEQASDEESRSEDSGEKKKVTVQLTEDQLANVRLLEKELKQARK